MLIIISSLWYLSLCFVTVQVTETEMLYRQCVCEANNHQKELEKVKRKILVHIRKLICQGDTVLKEVGSPLETP